MEPNSGGPGVEHAVREFALLIRRDSTECARVTVYANDREEAERLGEERAREGSVLWEDECEDLTVEVEGR